MLNLTYVAVVILIPVVPAYLLYKYLPAGKAEVGGPFKGLDIKLSGAFAGYFLVLLIASSLLVFLIKTTPVPCPSCPPPPPNRYEVYTVTGKVAKRKSGLKAGDALGFSLMPPERLLAEDGTFKFEIPVKPGQSGALSFPSMVVTCTDPKFERVTIDLDNPDPSLKIVYDHVAKTIAIKSELILERRPEGAGETQVAQPLAPVPSPSSQP